MAWLEDARTPDGLRLYAMGDIHGCVAPLVRRYQAIRADLAANPVADYRIILLGDLVDRGPASPGVLDWLIAEMAADPRVISVRGNHDTYLSAFMADPMTDTFWGWASYGGAKTMADYGIAPDRIDPDLDGWERRALHADLSRLVPDSHLALIRGLPLTLIFGDYLFVHAGLRPGVPLERQDEEDLLWIREPFLSAPDAYSHVVVHGHTVSTSVDVRCNRIGIDTGLVFGRELSCLVLEGDARCLLRDNGRRPLPDPV
ncbi:MAG: metallophosphoesterase family protein [Pseudomonadota bacterium]